MSCLKCGKEVILWNGYCVQCFNLLCGRCEKNLRVKDSVYCLSCLNYFETLLEDDFVGSEIDFWNMLQSNEKIAVKVLSKSSRNV